MVPYFSVKEELKNNKLQGEEVEPDRPTISTYLAYHKDKWISPAMDQMIQLIKRHAERWV
ncbi:LysR substrate-binding domain-containing protein [Paenibacillus illinoisensis]|uniref:LysR substrate-binding domain-containing protein n=1 Tax=Paenibacillus illinoisensis TaxID=59845 RepID=UPI003D980519